MICPECGTENPDKNEFCGKCGTSLKGKSSGWTPEPIGIIIGMVIIFAIYTVPLAPGPIHTVTIARSAEFCSSGYCISGQPWVFYGLWILGLFSIASGIFHKKE